MLQGPPRAVAHHGVLCAPPRNPSEGGLRSRPPTGLAEPAPGPRHYLVASLPDCTSFLPAQPSCGLGRGFRRPGSISPGGSRARRPTEDSGAWRAGDMPDAPGPAAVGTPRPQPRPPPSPPSSAMRQAPWGVVLKEGNGICGSASLIGARKPAWPASLLCGRRPAQRPLYWANKLEAATPTRQIPPGFRAGPLPAPFGSPRPPRAEALQLPPRAALVRRLLFTGRRRFPAGPRECSVSCFGGRSASLSHRPPILNMGPGAQ